MRASIVVPTRNADRTLERCLRSIRHCAAGIELIVVDNGSLDDTLGIAEQHADLVVHAGPERSAQRNAGAVLARGEVLIFVDADMVLSPGVVDEVVRLHDGGARAVVIPERSFGSGFWARCKALEKLVVLGDPGVEAARAFDRSTFDEVGGYDEALTACEDWELADRVCARFGPAPRTDATIWHDEGELHLRTTFAKKRYYGRWVSEWLRTAPPHRRRRAVSEGLPHMVAQPLTGLGLLVMKSVEAAGFALGVRDARRHS